jgi:hypothetical protein
MPWRGCGSRVSTDGKLASCPLRAKCGDRASIENAPLVLAPAGASRGGACLLSILYAFIVAEGHMVS